METTKKSNGNRPDIKSERFGIFQLAAWKDERVIKAKNDCDVEKIIPGISICLNIGQRKNGAWQDLRGWFPSSQFSNLKGAADDFEPKLKELVLSLEKELVEEVGSK